MWSSEELEPWDVATTIIGHKWNQKQVAPACELDGNDKLVVVLVPKHENSPIKNSSMLSCDSAFDVISCDL